MKKTLITTLLLGCLGMSCKSQDFDLGYRTFVGIDNTTISMKETVGNTLFSLYNHVDVEMPLCLYGTQKDDSTFTVDDVDFPYYFDLQPKTALFANMMCKEKDDYIGMVHNHFDPPSCYPSGIDLDRFFKDEKGKLEMIVCGTEEDDFKFEFFRKSDMVRDAYKEKVLDRLER